MHLILKLVLIVATAVLFAEFIIHRPGAEGKPVSRKTRVFLWVVGIIIGVVFLHTQGLYAPKNVI